MSLEKLIEFFKKIISEKKSMQIRINLHEGNISEKIEVKENRKL